MAHKYAELGSISSGTMRTDDVFDACIWTLKSLNKRKASTIQCAWDRVCRECETCKGDPCDGDCPDCDESRSWIVSETLWDELNSYAAPYTYFGAHEGDGADFGFWPSIDSLEEDCRNGEVLKVSDTSEVPRKYSGLVWHVNDHGNGTLYRCNTRGRLTELWSVV